MEDKKNGLGLNNESVKPWFKQWWGILLTIAFFPFIVPYLVWTETTWNKWIKGAITVICLTIFILASIASEKEKQEALTLAKQAETYISENKIDEALIAIKKSQKLNSSKNENSAFELEKNIANLQSAELLKKSLIELPDSDFELLKKKELKKKYIDHEKLNELFLSKLYENASQRAVYIAEVAELKKKEKEESERKKQQEEIAAQNEKKSSLVNGGSDSGNSGSRTTVGGQAACLTEEYLDDIIKAAVNKDEGSFRSYLTQQKCVILKAGIPVTIMKVNFTTIQFMYNGVKFWTVSEGISR